VTKFDRFFEQKKNVVGEFGHSTIQKVTATLQMLAYGIPTDLVDDHLAMSDIQAIKCAKCFLISIVRCSVKSN
jgi:hypothetical protein